MAEKAKQERLWYSCIVLARYKRQSMKSYIQKSPVYYRRDGIPRAWTKLRHHILIFTDITRLKDKLSI